MLGKLPSTQTGKTLLKAMGDMGAEGFEEYAQDALNPLVRNLLLQEDNEVKLYDDEYLYSTVLGALTAGILNAPGNAVEFSSAVRADREGATVGDTAPASGAVGVIEIPDDVDVMSVDTETEDISQAEEPIKAGRATTIKAPYTGEIPTYTKPENITVPQIDIRSVDTAKEQIVKANEISQQTGKSFRNYITDFYNRVFEDMGGAHGVEIEGLKQENGKNYIVTINKNAVAKVVSDPNLSAEKLAIFDNLDDVVENGEYVGSGEYNPHGSRLKNIVRYDYFETQVNIDSKPYLVSFDVSVLPNQNNYRMHKVINEINLTQIPSADTGPVPAAKGNALDLFDFNISQPENPVNSGVLQLTAKDEEDALAETDVLQPSMQSINTYIENAASNTGKNAEYMPFAIIEGDEANELSKILGVDVAGFKHGFRDNDIRHLLINPENTIEDIKNIPNIVANADIKFKGKNTDQYENFPQLSNKPTIYYVKRHNGTTYYLEQVIDEDGIMAPKQLKKIPTGSIPKWIDKLPVSDSERQLIKQKIIELSSSQHADVLANAIPREHVQNELLSNFDSSISKDISQSLSSVNSGVLQLTAKGTAKAEGLSVEELAQKIRHDESVRAFKKSMGIDLRTDVEKETDKQKERVATMENLVNKSVYSKQDLERVKADAEKKIASAQARQKNADYQRLDRESGAVRQAAIKEKHGAEIVTVVEKLAELKGLSVKYFSDSDTDSVNGFILGDKIYINTADPDVMFKTAVHETLHSLRESNKREYAALLKSIMQLANKNDKFNKLAAAVADTYTAAFGEDITQDMINEEIVCKLSEELARDPDSFFEAIGNNRSIAQQFLDFIRGVKNNIAIKLTGSQKAMLDEAQRNLDNFLRGEGATGAEVKYSVKMDAEGKPFVVIDEDILEGVPQREWVATVKTVFSEKFLDGIDMGFFNIGLNAKGKNEFLNSEYTKRLKTNAQDIYKKKMMMSNNLDEIVKNAYNVKNEPLKHARKDNLTSFNRDSINVKIGNNIYSVKVITGINKSAKENFYDIISIKKTETSLMGSPQMEMPLKAMQSKLRTFSKDVSIADNISQASENVNNVDKKQQKDPQKSIKIDITKGKGTGEFTVGEYVQNAAEEINGRTAKSVRLQQQYENVFADKVSNIFGVPNFDKQLVIKDMIKGLSADIKNLGHLPQSHLDDLFSTAYDKGINVSSELYDDYKGLKDEIYSARIAPLQGREFERFKEQYGRKIFFKEGGENIDTFYNELNE